MPRFSEWAAEQRSASSTTQPQNVACGLQGGPQRFLVDNSSLRSDSSGLRYRSSPDGEKNRTLKPVAWGRCVWGVLNDTQTWLKVKAGRYLPVTVQGCNVLKLQLDDPEPFEEEVEEILWIRPLKSLTGSGSCYEIAAEKAALRRGPSFNAATIIWLSQGDAVELFGWDESWQWRQCLEPRKRLVGWLLLARHDAALVQPQGDRAPPWRPQPLCDAAAEGRLPDVRRYLHELPIAAWPRDEQGRTPLQLSVLHQHLPCAVRLLEAGADAAEALRECEQRHEEIDELCSALLGAFTGESASSAMLQLALKSLDPAERNVARTQLARLQGTKSEDSIDDDFDDLDVASTETAEGESKGELGETSCLYEASEASESSEKEALRSQIVQRKKRRSRRASFSGRGQAASSRASSPVSDSEVEVKTADAFRNWLEDRPSMFRLSAVRCVDTGIAWDFPLTKSEKRELLLMYVAQGEKMAEESACQALDQERRHRKSLESARAALARMRKKTCRRSKPGRRSLGGVNF